MKTCTYCGKELPDEATVCPVDGEPLQAVVPPVLEPSPPPPPRELPKSSKSSIGRPFWMGFLGGTILFMFFCLGSGILQDNLALCLFAGVAVVVIGPVGGVITQVIHDVVVARRLRLLHLGDFLVFIGIAIALVVAGQALYHAPAKQSDIHLFRNKTFDIAGALVVLLVVIYVIRDSIARFSSRQSSNTQTAGKTLPHHIRAFVAGGFALIFFQAFVRGICDFVASAIAGKFLWPLLIGAVVTGLGVALGVALLAGCSWALRLVRLFLILVVAGEGLSFVSMPLIHVKQPEAWKTVADMIVNLTILALLAWKPPKTDAHEPPPSHVYG